MVVVAVLVRLSGVRCCLAKHTLGRAFCYEFAGGQRVCFWSIVGTQQCVGPEYQGATTGTTRTSYQTGLIPVLSYRVAF